MYKNGQIFCSAIILLLSFNCSNNNSGRIETKNNEENSPLAELQKNLGEMIIISPTIDTSFNYRQFSKDTTLTNEDSVSLTLLKDNGKILSFKNVHNPNDETSAKDYEYKGFETLTNLYWITENLYESQNTILVSKIDGKEYQVSNEPKINLDGSFIFTKQDDCFMMFDDCSPGFQIWKISNNKLDLFKEVKLDKYFISTGGWKTNDVLLIELKPLEFLTNQDNPDYQKKYLYQLKINH